MGSKLKCRVCGNLYTGCRSAFPNDGVFRWQTVACSPECGEKYLKEILESREVADSNDEQENKPINF